MASLVRFWKENQARIVFTLLAFLYLLLLFYAYQSSIYVLLGLPLVGIFLYLCITNYKWLWYMIVFLMPLSVNDPKFFGPFAGITFPTDLLAIAILGIVTIKYLSEPNVFAPFRRNPIVMVVALNLLWTIFTCVATTMPLVSWKYFAATLWMAGGFFYMPLLLFQRTGTIFRYFQLTTIAFSLAFVTVMVLFLSTGRNPFGLRFNPSPFFVDHTVFGAFLAMWIPILGLLSFAGDIPHRERWMARVGLLVCCLGLFFSYSRGAWASCIAALVVMVVVLLGRWAGRLLLPGMMLGLLLGTLVWYGNIYQDKNATNNDAVSRKNLSEHIRSITNFKTDDSNRERVNRWKCAWRMFLEKPAFGWGPGTYTFEYAAFQTSQSRTKVSTNRGDNGSAHNEWLLSLSEKGLMGALLLTCLFAVPLYCGLRGYHIASRRNTRLLYLGTTFSLITYDIHAFVNNFMDQDKVGGSYFALMAVIAVLDVHVLPKEKGMPQESLGWSFASRN
jgi:putative inorganic carbon (hco3(-)) transporter